jgi:hypothetical protein
MVAEPLADVGPVFLFDMGIVILVVGSAAGKLDGFASLCKVSEKVVVEELGSIIRIEAKQRERQG